jgi:hypothetical protein
LSTTTTTTTTAFAVLSVFCSFLSRFFFLLIGFFGFVSQSRATYWSSSEKTILASYLL